jgi:aldehyde:ferredoxin oxidoreductase
LGAVWGKKNLKALVVEGKGEPGEAVSKKYEAAKDAVTKELSDPRPDSARFNLRSQSEKTWVLEADQNGLPSLNFSQTDRNFENLRRAIFSEVSEEHSCQGCPVGCKDVVSYNDGFLRVVYNNVVSLGPLLGLEEAKDVLALLYLARELGLDPVSLGVALAFLTEKNSWEFGDLETYKALIEGIVAREEPWAKELSLGVMKAVTPQSRDYAMVLSDLEMEPYFNGYLATLSQIVAAEDSFDYNLAHLLDFKELEGDEAVETLVAEEKKGLVLASLALCPLLRGVYNTSQIFSCLEGLGLNWKHEDLEALGTKIYNLKWKLKSKLGFSWEDQHLPQRLFAVPTATGYMEESKLCGLFEDYKKQIGDLL